MEVDEEDSPGRRLVSKQTSTGGVIEENGKKTYSRHWVTGVRVLNIIQKY